MSRTLPLLLCLVTSGVAIAGQVHVSMAMLDRTTSPALDPSAAASLRCDGSARPSTTLDADRVARAVLDELERRGLPASSEAATGHPDPVEAEAEAAAASRRTAELRTEADALVDELIELGGPTGADWGEIDAVVGALPPDQAEAALARLFDAANQGHIPPFEPWAPGD